jgi:hypothetical protein
MGTVGFSVRGLKGAGEYFLRPLGCSVGNRTNVAMDRHFNGEESFDTGPMAPPSEVPTSPQDTSAGKLGLKL